jgi:hypothetical protein
MQTDSFELEAVSVDELSRVRVLASAGEVSDLSWTMNKILVVDPQLSKAYTFIADRLVEPPMRAYTCVCAVQAVHGVGGNRQRRV